MTFRLLITLIVAGLIVTIIVAKTVVKAFRAASLEIDRAVAEIDLGREITGWSQEEK